MRKFFLLVCATFFLLPSICFSANVDTFGIGAKATALGGAYSAYADDVYAVYYNPAGLTQIKNMQFSLGSVIIDPDLKGKNFRVEENNSYIAGPVDFDDESPLLVAPHLGFVIPINNKLTFGIAAYVPYGLHLAWDDTENFPLNPASYNCYESWYYRVVTTPTIAYKVSDRLSIGFGISLGKSEAGTYLNSYDMLPLTVREKIELTDDFNYSFNLGLMYKITDSFILGITYRSMADADFDGELKLTDLSQMEKQILQARGLTRYKTDVSMDDVNHPRQIQIGLRYSPHSKISIEADVVWTQWSMVDYQTLQIKDPMFQAALGGKEIKIKRDWKDTKQVKIGVEWKATDILTLRCGYFYDPTPIPDDTFDNMWPDADKKTYSLGAGLKFGKWQIDGVFQYTITEKDRVIGGESEPLNETYDGARVSLKAGGQLYGYGLTINYNF